MRWYKFSERRPKIRQVIFVKLKEAEMYNEYYWYPCPYYMVRVEKNLYNGHTQYTEALGEGYMYWEEDELLGWTPVEEIQDTEEWS